MKFIGLFVAAFLLIVIGLSVFTFLFENIWGLVALAAFMMALVVRMYMSLDERLDRIEQHLGLKTEEAKTLTEQLADDKTAP